MKKGTRIAIIVGIILLAIAYFAMTRIGALRLAIIASGHPVNAFTFEVKEKPYKMDLTENQEGISIDNPPAEKGADAELVNWVVTKHGIFYTAEYYGW